jgi:hypothetical protein
MPPPQRIYGEFQTASPLKWLLSGSNQRPRRYVSPSFDRSLGSLSTLVAMS